MEGRSGAVAAGQRDGAELWMTVVDLAGAGRSHRESSPRALYGGPNHSCSE